MVSPIAQEEVGAVEADNAIVEVWTYLTADEVSALIPIGVSAVHLTVIQAFEACIQQLLLLVHSVGTGIRSKQRSRPLAFQVSSHVLVRSIILHCS